MAEDNPTTAGYMYFKLFVNIIVFLCLLILLFFVEIKTIKQQIGIIPGLVPTLFISALLLIFGLITMWPKYDKFVGITLIIFSVIIFAANLSYYLKEGASNLNLATEFLMSIVLFMYGIDLMSQKGSFISLNVLADKFK